MRQFRVDHDHGIAKQDAGRRLVASGGSLTTSEAQLKGRIAEGNAAVLKYRRGFWGEQYHCGGDHG